MFYIFYKVLYGNGIIDLIGSDPRPSETGKMSSGVQFFSQVPGQGPNVGSLAAFHQKRKIRQWRFQNFQLTDADSLGL